MLRLALFISNRNISRNTRLTIVIIGLEPRASSYWVTSIIQIVVGIGLIA
jgi:hypothetical protein